MPLPIPYIIGCDLAGMVEAVGPQATRFKPGDRVWGSNQGLLGRQGTFAEYAAVDEQWLYPTPAGRRRAKPPWRSRWSASRPHLGLVRDAKLKAGDTLFVNGGIGGVGSMVVQMAKATGARVITTAGSPEKVQALPRVGGRPGDQLQDRGRRRAHQGVRAAGRERVVGNAARAEFRSGRRPARRRAAGWSSWPVAKPARRFPSARFTSRAARCSALPCSTPRPTNSEPPPTISTACWPPANSKPNIDRVLPLSAAAAAHRLQEENTLHKAGTLAGKIVLRV